MSFTPLKRNPKISQIFSKIHIRLLIGDIDSHETTASFEVQLLLRLRSVTALALRKTGYAVHKHYLRDQKAARLNQVDLCIKMYVDLRIEHP